MKKLFAIGIIFLFIGVAVAPSINARNPKAISNPEKEVSLTVLEYKPDGTIGKTVIKMTQGQSERLRAELKGVSDLNTRLSIYKKYGLIPQNITVDKLREGMKEKAQKMGLTQQKLTQLILKNDKINRNKWIYFNIMCSVSVDGGCDIFFPWGVPEGNGFHINIRLMGFNGYFTTKGLLHSDLNLMSIMFCNIVCFVGYLSYSGGGYWGTQIEMTGFSVYIRAFMVY